MKTRYRYIIRKGDIILYTSDLIYRNEVKNGINEFRLFFKKGDNDIVQEKEEQKIKDFFKYENFISNEPYPKSEDIIYINKYDINNNLVTSHNLYSSYLFFYKKYESGDIAVKIRCDYVQTDLHYYTY